MAHFGIHAVNLDLADASKNLVLGRSGGTVIARHCKLQRRLTLDGLPVTERRGAVHERTGHVLERDCLILIGNQRVS